MHDGDEARIGVIAINAPTSDCGLGAETVTLTIMNFTAFAQSDFDVQFQLTGPISTGPVTETFTGTLPASGTAMYTFSGTANLSSPENYLITATTLLTDDPNAANNAATANVENEGSCVKPYVFLADEVIKIDQNKESDGDMHCNERIEFGKATSPGKHTGDLTAVGKIKLEDKNKIGEQLTVSSYQLEQNYPNPFNPTTVISFQLPVASEVELAVYNLNGKLVKKLVAGEMNAGSHNLSWDATDEIGARVASGVYLYILKAGEFTARKKLLLMK